MHCLSLAVSYELARKLRQVLAGKPGFVVHSESTLWEFGDLRLCLVDERVAELVAVRPQPLGSRRLAGAILEGNHPGLNKVGAITNEPICVYIEAAEYRQLRHDQTAALRQLCQLVE